MTRTLTAPAYEPVQTPQPDAGIYGRSLTEDGALVEFASAVDALTAGIEFQQEIADANRDKTATTVGVLQGLHRAT